MKLSVLNVHFSSPVDFSKSRPPKFKQASTRERQRGVPIKVVILPLLAHLALADKHRLVAYRNNNCWQAFSDSTLMTLKDTEPPK